MREKGIERTQAIIFRKRGMSYRDILENIPVAKSTLSLWLRQVHLSQEQRQRLTEKRKAAQLRGAETRHRQRLLQTEIIKREAREKINRLSDYEKLLIGSALYWAEGSKQREGRWGTGVIFANSDPHMLRMFRRWLFDVASISENDLVYEIFLHKNHIKRLKEIRRFWAHTFNISVRKFQKIYYKRHNPKNNRKNNGNKYYGLVRIRVRASSALNRKIAGWIEGICANWGVV